MALTNIIAHRIERALENSSAGAESSLYLRDQEWPINDDTEECFREIKQAVLRRSGKDYGVLSDESEFKSFLDKLKNQDISFTEFCEKGLGAFKKELDLSELSLNYHVFMAFESLQANDVMHMYFLEQERGRYIDSELSLTDTLSLNTGAIKFGIKINLGDLYDDSREAHERAVTLLRARGDKEIGALLERATGFGDKKDIASETDALLQTINSYTKEMPDDVASFAKTHAVNYCLEQEKSGEPVVVKKLSNDLAQQIDEHQNSFESTSSGSYTPPPKFENFALESNSEIKNEIIADKTKLRNFVRISGRNEQMSMSFASSCLGDSVVYDAATDSLIVKSIPSSLKSRLIKLVQGE